MEKFINYVMEEGKKAVARKIISDCFAYIAKESGKDPVAVFEKALENVMPDIEVRPRRIGGGVYQVPTEVKADRQFSLASRWILTAARHKKGRPMYFKLAKELMEAYDNAGDAIKKKQEVHRMAEANKTFAHLARYS